MKKICFNCGIAKKTAFAAICAAALAPLCAKTVDGDHTISEDTTLTEDLTVTGTLTIENGAKIDLAGRKLTVQSLVAGTSPNLVANGSFENYEDKTTKSGHYYGYKPTIYYAFFHTYDSICEAGPLALSDWDCAMASGDAGAGLAQNNIINTDVPDGKNVLFYLGKRTISQTVDIPAAGRYSLSYYYGARGNTTSGGHVQIDIGAKTDLAPVHCTSKTASKTECFVELPAGAQTFKIRGTGGGSGNSSHHWMDDVTLKRVPGVTDTSSGGATPGELHITGENGATALNGGISVEGNLKLFMPGQTFDGDWTASADTILTGDLTVNGTLSIANGATIDLQGRKLTVNELENASQSIVVNGNFDTDPSPSTVTVPTASNTHLYLAKSNTKGEVDSSGIRTYVPDWAWEGWSNPYHGAGLCRAGGTFVDSSLSVGKYAAFLHGASPRYLGQELYIPAGRYKWSFDHARRKNDSNPTIAFRLVQNGAVVKDLWTGSSSSKSSFDTENGIVTVEEAGIYSLWFQLTSTGDRGTVLDNVKLTPFATIANTSTGAPGELRLAVPKGTTLAHDFITISGNLDFVKDGEGTFTCATEGLMAYSGDTYVTGGKYVCGLGGSKHPFGHGKNLVVNGDFENVPYAIDDYKYRWEDSSIMSPWTDYANDNSGTYVNNKRTGGGITKKGGSNFDAAGYATGEYGAFLHGIGTSGNGISQELAGVPAGVYRWSFRHAARTITLNQKPAAYLYMDFTCSLIDGNGTVVATLCSPTSADEAKTASGTVPLESSGTYTLQFKIKSTTGNTHKGIVIDDVVFERIDKEVHIASGATLDLNGKSGFGDCKFVVGEGGTIINSGAAISESIAVSGVFAPVATTGSFGVVLQDGATLGLGASEGTLDLANVSFASGAAIKILLDGRQDLDSIAKANSYVVRWGGSQPGSVVLEGKAAKDYRIEADSTGARLTLPGGIMVVFK